MADAKEPGEVLVLFKALTKTDNVHPERRLTLTKESPIIPIGRSSKRRLELEPARTNAFFDCPVMSREHAELHLDSDKRVITIQDTGSLHGTLLNQLALRPTETRVVNSGDIISFGQAINRGADQFTPHQVKATITWKDSMSDRNVSTYRVPDDTDIEEVSDKDDGAPEMAYARKILSENSYHTVDCKDNHIDLTSPRLPPISSFDTPSRTTAMVDLTSDETSFRRRFGSSNLSQYMQSNDESFTKPIEDHRSPLHYRDLVYGDHMDGDIWEDDGSYASPSDDLDISDDDEMESSEEEDDDDADVDISEAGISDEEAEDMWGVDDDDLVGLNVDDAVPEANGCVNSDASLLVGPSLSPSNVRFHAPPTPLPTTVSAGMDPKPTNQEPSFAPAEIAYNLDIDSPRTAHQSQSNNMAFKGDKAEFFRAREENRKTLGLPPKAGEANIENQPEEVSSPDSPGNIVLKNGPDVDLSNELLRTGDDFLNEPIKHTEANRCASEDNEPILDETSAYQFQMSKKAASQAANAKVALPAEPSSGLEEPRKTTPKRKVDDISDSTPEEEEAMKPELTPVKETVIPAPTIAPGPSTHLRHHDPMSLSGPIERPVKRLRRAVEAVGYAAIGGIAVMSALIATAPQL